MPVTEKGRNVCVQRLAPIVASIHAIHVYPYRCSDVCRSVWQGTPEADRLNGNPPVLYYSSHIEPDAPVGWKAPLSAKRARPMIDRSRERNWNKWQRQRYHKLHSFLSRLRSSGYNVSDLHCVMSRAIFIRTKTSELHNPGVLPLKGFAIEVRIPRSCETSFIIVTLQPLLYKLNKWFGLNYTVTGSVQVHLQGWSCATHK